MKLTKEQIGLLQNLVIRRLQFMKRANGVYAPEYVERYQALADALREMRTGSSSQEDSSERKRR